MKFASIFLSGCWLLGFSLLSLSAASPIVTNVVASQRVGTKLIDIRYDVFDGDNDPLKVRIEISHNGGTNYLVPAITLTGDVGDNIIPVTNKLVVWNAGVDWDGEYSPQMRVKVIASDGRGFPGLQWGQEVPAGGFILGQDGGAEGVGPAKHVNIPYSYWLSKYEITVEQYAEFLNIAVVAGDVWRSNNEIKAGVDMGSIGIPANTTIYTLGTDLQWNLNKIEILQGRMNLPVVINWYGAIAFARHYGYDLPTDAEWEKAARGPNHDGLGEHQVYPWGNSINGGNANYSGSGDPFAEQRSPVGYYNGSQLPFGPDMANGYGLYDIAGNVGEWTRTAYLSSDEYPSTESPSNAIHAYSPSIGRSIRGGGYPEGTQRLRCFDRSSAGQSGSSGYWGFRVVRRSQ